MPGIGLGLRPTGRRRTRLAVGTPAPDVTAPTITSADPSGTYDEGVAVGGTLTADESVTWSVSGTDAAAVTLNASTGVWSLEATDYETKTSYAFTFTATDGASNTDTQAVAITIADVAEGGLATPTLTWTSSTSEPDPEFTMSEIAEGDTAQIQIDDNSDFSSTYGDDTNGIDAAEAFSGAVVFTGIPSLLGSTTYYARARYQRAAVWSDWSATVSKTMDTAAVLSSPTDTENGLDAMTGAVTTDTGSGTLYWYISTSATPPSAADLKAGTGAVVFGSQAVSGTGAQAISDDGLASATTYYTHYLQRVGGFDSNIASADGFTTDTPVISFVPSDLWTAAQYGYAWDPTDTGGVWQDSARTTAGAAGQPVGALDDIGSGSSRHFLQATSGSRPTLTDIGGGVLAVTFNGTSSSMALAASGLYAAGFCTIIFAAKNLNTAQVTKFFLNEGGATDTPVYVPYTGIGSTAQGRRGWARNDSNAQTLNVNGAASAYDGSWHVYTVKDTGSVISMARDGTAFASDSYTRSGTLSLTKTGVGALTRSGVGSWANIQIGRFIAIARNDLTPTEIADAEAWCAAPYGITLP